MSSSTQEIRVRLELLSGPKAIWALEQSGLMESQDSLPLLPLDVKALLDGETGFAILGYAEDHPIGYIVGTYYWPGRGERHLFIHQAVHIGHPEWSKIASQYLDDLARRNHCDAISMTVPINMAPLMQRRYKYLPLGIYMVKRLGEVQ